MLSLAPLLSWLLLQPGLVFPLVAGHEACMADRQESVRSSSLIQGVSWKYRSFVDQQSPQRAKTNSQNLQILNSRLAKTVGSTDRGITSPKRSEKGHKSNPGENATSKEVGPPQHRLMSSFVSLLQLRSPGNGAVGAIIFITAVFFLLGMVLMLIVHMEAFVTKGAPERSQVPPREVLQYPNSSTSLPRQSTTSTVERVSTPPGRDSPGVSRSTSLSPQLVVPEDRECALVIQMPASGWRGSFSVCDVSGNAVLKVLIQDRASQTGSFTQAQQLLEIQLCSSATPTSMVGRCRLLKGTFCVYQKDNDDLFGTVASESVGKARLVVTDGGYFDFSREDEDSIKVVDEHQQLHGTSETYVPQEDSPLLKVFRPVRGDERDLHLVRVGPLSDAGLILCGLMCLHQLDMQRRQ